MVCVKKFSSIFDKNGQSNLVLILVLVLESKALYFLDGGDQISVRLNEKDF